MDVAGTKVVVAADGAGEDVAEISWRRLSSAKQGAELASCYIAADVFVFPSRTDTFGLVNIEALACGLPVAAYPCPVRWTFLDLMGAALMADGGQSGRSTIT